MRRTVLLTAAAILILAPFVFGQQDNGDVNCDAGINILDVTSLINYLYKGGPPPCPILGAGVNYVYDDQVDLDLDFYYTTLTYLPVYAPANGWIAFDYSFYMEDEAYCMQLLLGETREEGGIPDERGVSHVTTYTTSSPITWHQIMPIDSGTTWYALSVKSCARDGEESAEDEKVMVTFRNVNLSATFYPVYYGSTPD